MLPLGEAGWRPGGRHRRTLDPAAFSERCGRHRPRIAPHGPTGPGGGTVPCAQRVGICHRWNDRMVAAERHVQLGRAALWGGDGTGARGQLELGDLTPEVFEGLAAASYVLFEYPRAIAEFERAYAGYRQQGDGSGSARVARTFRLHVRTTAGDWAVASGWIARAKTLLSELPTSSE